MARERLLVMYGDTEFDSKSIIEELMAAIKMYTKNNDLDQ